MKKFIQSILFGYRENKEAYKSNVGFTTTFKGGTSKEKFNALLSLKNELKDKQLRY